MRGCGAATVTLDRAERAMVMAMAKNRVHLKIGGSAYTVLTDDAPEYVEELAEELDKEMRSIINENPSLSVTQAAVLTALDKADTCKKIHRFLRQSACPDQGLFGRQRPRPDGSGCGAP